MKSLDQMRRNASREDRWISARPLDPWVGPSSRRGIECDAAGYFRDELRQASGHYLCPGEEKRLRPSEIMYPDR